MGFRDMDLDDQVRATLRRDQELSPFRINVNVKNGIVYLQGNVTAHAKEHVLSIVSALGVPAVIDQMTITQ